jgi:L-fuconolactonase
MNAAGTAVRRPVVDAHAHVFRPASVSPRGVDDLAPAGRDAPVEDLLRVMDDAGVDAAVLVPLDTHDEYVAEVLHEHPTRFAAVAVARPCDLGRERDAAGRMGPDALEARRRSFAFSAVRTSWLGSPGEPVTSSPVLPLLRHLAEQELVLWTYLPPDQLPLLGPVLDTVPGLMVVLNHFGFCPHDMQVDEHGRPRFSDPFPPGETMEVLRLAEHPGVHVMLSGQYALSAEGAPYADLHEVTRQVVRAYGPRRTLWASDYPWTRDVPGYATMPDLIPQALPELTDEDLAWVLGRTALSLFPKLAPHLQEMH